MRLDTRNIPIGRLVNCKGKLYGGMARIHTTTVCKIKPNKGFKVRMCLRGDMQQGSRVHFAPAPTVGRDFIKLFVSLFVLHPSWRKCAVDITKAFAQSDYLAKEDRCLAILPKYFQSRTDNWECYIAVNHNCAEFDRDGGRQNGEGKCTTESADTFDSAVYGALCCFGHYTVPAMRRRAGGYQYPPAFGATVLNS